MKRFENGFQIEDVAIGQPDGKAAKAGQRVTVQYTGRLQSNGKVFDTSKGKGFTFRLGEAQSRTASSIVVILPERACLWAAVHAQHTSCLPVQVWAR